MGLAIAHAGVLHLHAHIVAGLVPGAKEGEKFSRYRKCPTAVTEQQNGRSQRTPTSKAHLVQADMNAVTGQEGAGCAGATSTICCAHM
jgi:hypothetical protein